MKLIELRQKLKTLANPERAAHSLRFFKTGVGEYGEGDCFMGITVPQLRRLAKQAYDLTLEQLQQLLDSKWHEERLVALLILVEQFQKTHDPNCVDFYLKNTDKVNNWDLVDSSAPYLLGIHLLSRDPELLYKLAKSKNLWERRIAIISTFAFIRAGRFEHTLVLAEMLLEDKHDLIHKAVGWMLRELGKRDQTVLEKFLATHAARMPRTALRYAIERFPEKQRKQYLLQSRRIPLKYAR